MPTYGPQQIIDMQPTFEKWLRQGNTLNQNGPAQITPEVTREGVKRHELQRQMGAGPPTDNERRQRILNIPNASMMPPDQYSLDRESKIIKHLQEMPIDELEELNRQGGIANYYQTGDAYKEYMKNQLGKGWQELRGGGRGGERTFMEIQQGPEESYYTANVNAPSAKTQAEMSRKNLNDMEAWYRGREGQAKFSPDALALLDELNKGKIELQEVQTAAIKKETEEGSLDPELAAIRAEAGRTSAEKVGEALFESSQLEPNTRVKEWIDDVYKIVRKLKAGKAASSASKYEEEKAGIQANINSTMSSKFKEEKPITKALGHAGPRSPFAGLLLGIDQPRDKKAKYIRDFLKDRRSKPLLDAL